MKESKVKLVSFTLEKKLVDVLDGLSKKNLRNRSKLINRLLKDWLVIEGYIVSGSI